MIVVLGSINNDVVLTTDRLPRAGETVRATSMATHPGGKGANQATAIARLGERVTLIGRVGDDPAGNGLLNTLASEGIDVSRIAKDADAPTGTALITVDDAGANTIVTAGGANHRVGAEELDGLRQALGRASMLLVQLEVPMDVVASAVDLARSVDVPVMLDPAPVAPLPDELYAHLTWITPNEHEAEVLGAETSSDLQQRGVTHAVITLGERGCAYSGPGGDLTVKAPKVAAIDTVACGDAFNGALAVALGRTMGVERALAYACAAGAAAATRAGAATSLPTPDRLSSL